MKVETLFQRVYDDWAINERRSVASMMCSARWVEKLLGDRDAARLTVDDIRRYVVQRKKAGAANATINAELAVLRKGYRMAIEAGVLVKMPRIQKLTMENVRQGTYTQDEVQQICMELKEVRSGHMVPAVWFAYHTGRRRGEILQLKWEDIDLKRRLVTIRQGTAKNREPDQIPLEGELYGLLAKLAEEREEGCPWVFHKKGKKITGDSMSHAFERAAKKAGLEGRIFHDFRRTAATDLINAGVDQSTAMRVTGHRSTTVFQRYRIVKVDTVREAMATLQEHRSGAPAKRATMGQKLAHARELWPDLP